MDINNSTMLEKVLKERILTPLIISVSKEIVNLVQEELDNAPISTTTMQKYTMYQLSNTSKGLSSTIYVNDELMQGEQDVGTYGHFNRFMSLDMSTNYGGKNIAWRLVSWLEDKGAQGELGNNPFQPIGMFQKAYLKIERNLYGWVSKFSAKYGITIVRG